MADERRGGGYWRCHGLRPRLRGIYADQGGPGIVATLERILATTWEPVRRLVPDERPAIEASIVVRSPTVSAAL